MKRRGKKNDLGVLVPGSEGMIKNSLGHGHMITDMGPPLDTPFRRNINTIVANNRYITRGMSSNSGQLESPFALERHVMFGDFPTSAGDTPSRLLHSLESGTGSRVASDSLRFDFDEVVQFPSPRPGDAIPSASPGLWSNGSFLGSAGSNSIFTFSDALYPKGNRSHYIIHSYTLTLLVTQAHLTQ